MSKINDAVEDFIEDTLEDANDISDENESHTNEGTMSIVSKLSAVKIAILAGGAVAIIAILLSIFVFDPFHLNLSFFGRKTEIEKTNNVVTGIKKITEFTTACFYEEIVLQEYKYKPRKRTVYKKVETGNYLKDKLQLGKEQEMVIIDSVRTDQVVAVIVHGKVRAGYDFSKITEGDLLVNHDTLVVKLPEVEVFDVIVNPSDIDIFDRQGKWDDEEIKDVVSKAKSEIEKDALEHGLLEKASTSGKEKIAQMFKSFGFSEVQVQQ